MPHFGTATGLAIEVRFVWWWELYVYGLMLVAFMTGLEPDWAKVNDKQARALRFRFPPARRWHRIVED